MIKKVIVVLAAVMVSVIQIQAGPGGAPITAGNPLNYSQAPTPYQQMLINQQNAAWQRQQATIAAQKAAEALAKKNQEEKSWIEAASKSIESIRDSEIAKIKESYQPSISNADSQLTQMKNRANELEALKATFWVTNYNVKPTAGTYLVSGKICEANSLEWVYPAAQKPALNVLDNPWNAIGYSLKVETVQNDKITCGVYRNEYRHETYTGQLGLESSLLESTIVIFHYPNPRSLVTGQEINPRCIRVENYISGGISLEAYDCGVPATENYTQIVPGPPDAATAKAILENQKQFEKCKSELNDLMAEMQKEITTSKEKCSAKIAELPSVFAAQERQNQDAKKQALADKVLKSNQDAADRGDAYGLLRMGERYRDGEGVPKDLDKARDYLTKADAAGSPSAAEELKNLPVKAN